jgi:hypothetical protein
VLCDRRGGNFQKGARGSTDHLEHELRLVKHRHVAALNLAGGGADALLPQIAPVRGPSERSQTRPSASPAAPAAVMMLRVGENRAMLNVLAYSRW